MPLGLMGLMGALGIGSGSETGPRMEGYHLTADGNGHRSGSVRAAGAGGVEGDGPGPWTEAGPGTRLTGRSPMGG